MPASRGHSSSGATEGVALADAKELVDAPAMEDGEETVGLDVSKLELVDNDDDALLLELEGTSVHGPKRAGRGELPRAGSRRN